MTRIALAVSSLMIALVPVDSVCHAGAPQQETGSRGTITVQALMQNLAAYGVWMNHPQFGWVWQPHDVQPWWQPFCEGEWIVTQDGSPYWRSAYPFGWATEHFGSWTYDQRKGWLWVPGREWSAAPVSWRGADGVIGWAPRLADQSRTQSSECPQPTFAWIFVSPTRLLTANNFEVAEKELLSNDIHNTWGAWAHDQHGVVSSRLPPARNINLLDVTKCLGASDANAAFAEAARSRGITTTGPSINFVSRRSEMGSGRAQAGYLPVYAPEITGDAPPATGAFVLNPPAQPVQPATPATYVSRVPPASPVTPPSGARPLRPVSPAAPALPVPAVAPASAVPAVTAYGYQRALLDQYHAQLGQQLRQLQESDSTASTAPGLDPSKLPAWRQRELEEAAREADRQRKLLEARQQEDPGSSVGNSPSSKP
jgi:hypothetical protein